MQLQLGTKKYDFYEPAAEIDDFFFIVAIAKMAFQNPSLSEKEIDGLLYSCYSQFSSLNSQILHRKMDRYGDKDSRMCL